MTYIVDNQMYKRKINELLGIGNKDKNKRTTEIFEHV